MSNINIEFNIKNKSWLKYDKNISVSISNFLEEVSRKIKLNRILKKNINIEISVLLTNNDQIKNWDNNWNESKQINSNSNSNSHHISQKYIKGVGNVFSPKIIISDDYDNNNNNNNNNGMNY